MPCWWFCRQFLGGAFVKSRIATISFVSPVLPSARNSSAPAGRIFMKFDIEYFSKICQKIQVSLESDKNNGYFTWRPIYSFYHISLSFFRMRNASDKSCRANQNTHFMFNNFFRTSYRLWDNVEKYCGDGQATDVCMTHAHSMLNT